MKTIEVVAAIIRQKDRIFAACGYDLTAHHHALADAQACAQIALKIL